MRRSPIKLKDTGGLSRRILLYGCGLAGLAGQAIASVPPAVTQAEAVELGNRWARALEQGDLAAVAACYAPDMRIWNNIRRTFIPGSAHIAGLPLMFAKYSDRKYVDVRSDLLPDGFVRQHRLTGTQAGQAFDMPICYVARVGGGLFVQIEEYITLPAPPPLT